MTVQREREGGRERDTMHTGKRKKQWLLKYNVPIQQQCIVKYISRETDLVPDYDSRE